MKFKVKEKEVLRIHKNKITSPTINYNAWKTRVNGAKHNQIVRKTYEELINALHDFYFGDKKETLSLGECIERWISSREESGAIEYLTALHYRNDFIKYVKYTDFAQKDITAITKAQFLSFFEKIAGNGNNMRKSTFNNIRIIVNGGFYYANMLDGYNCLDPSKIRTTDIKKRCFVPNNDDDVFDKDEVITLIKYLQSLEQNVYTLAIQLCFCLSVRIGEIRAIPWEMYDEMNRLLTLNYSMVTRKTDNANREVIRVDYMKGHNERSKRTLQVSDYAAWVLDQLRAINGDKNYILQSSGLKPISTNQFNEHLRRYCNEAGIKYHSSHKIRFYACSTMYENGIDERTIQYYMGHSSVTTTRHYDRRKKKKLNDEKINQTFGFDLPAGVAEN